MHVEAYMEMSRDAGSIPAASIRLAALAHGRPFESYLYYKFHLTSYAILRRVECPE